MRIPKSWIEAIASWAQPRLDISAVYVFGSYAKNAHRSDSDLDIAVIVHSAHKTEDDFTRWFYLSDGWKATLQERLPVKIDLQLGNEDISTNVVGPAIKREGVLVYSRT